MACDVAGALGEKKLYLQSPEEVRSGILYDNPQAYGPVQQDAIGNFSDSVHWEERMRLLIYNWFPEKEYELLKLIESSFISGKEDRETMRNHDKAFQMVRSRKPDGIELSKCPHCQDNK